ncbi:MAG: sulfite exporter TauE/SafE family protein, partial [bacterium]|nr:sulfite exporter TauE/SafE family protein [bacterium]
MLPYLLPLFFLTALIYSTVGFGGGSTYLALLALFSFPYEAMPKVALVCNLVVVTGGCYFFFRQGYFSPKKILPFIVTSIPAAYLGGRIPLGKETFTFLLALSLLFAAFRMLISQKDFEGNSDLSWKKAWWVGIPAGALLGALSGLVGI